MSSARTGLICAVLGGTLVAGAMLPFLVAARRGSSEADAGTDPAQSVQAGRYVVRIAGCNDCHTPEYQQRGDAVPESQWLIGVPVGFKGPWGTSYPANLRTKAQALTEEQWLTFARNANGRPPMPWVSLHAMNDRDLRDVYRFIRSLGPSGNAVPGPLPPGQAPTTPYVVFDPVMPK